MEKKELNKLIRDQISKSYRPGKKLGEGSFSEVYELKDTEEPLVIKVVDEEDFYFRHDFDPERELQKEFHNQLKVYVEREINCLNEFKGSEHIVQLRAWKKFDDGSHYPNTAFLIEEKCEPLRCVINLGDQCDEETVIVIAKDICHAIEELESKNILHRDIKPGNIFVKTDSKGYDHFILGDFGAARQLPTSDQSSVTALGTTRYLAPELLRGFSVKKDELRYNNSDIYSLGITMIRLLMGAKKWRTEASLKDLEISQPLHAIIQKAIEISVDDRYQYAREMLDDLREIVPDPYDECDQTIDIRMQNAPTQPYLYERQVTEPEVSQPDKMDEKKIQKVKLVDYINNWKKQLPKFDKKLWGICLFALGSIAVVSLIGLKNSGASLFPLGQGHKAEDQVPYPPSEQPFSDWKEAEVGDSISFGHYYSSNEWIVLDKTDHQMLVISKYLIEDQGYHSVDESISWDTCSLRDWLNDDYYDKAFNESEQSAIISNADNVIDDNVFLLSYSEVSHYLASQNLRTATFTDDEKPSSWWIRNVDAGNVNIIIEDGSIKTSSKVDDEEIGVRPAMWLDLNAEIIPDSDLADSYVSLENALVGDEIVFGNYDSTNRWIVLNKSDDKVLILSKYIICDASYDQKDTKGNITWADSSIRDWLNDDYYNSAFSTEEQSMIAVTNLETRLSFMDESAGTIYTEDKVFLLSYEAVARYFPAIEQRFITYPNGRSGNWWMRSCDSELQTALVVNKNGHIYEDAPAVDSEFIGVRPAMWINLSEADEDTSDDVDRNPASDIKENQIDDSVDYSAIDPIELIGCDDYPEGSVLSVFGELVAQKIDEITGGQFTIDYHPNGDLGTDNDLLREVQNDELDIVVCQVPYAIDFISDLMVFNLPMMFTDKDAETIDRVINGDGEFHERLSRAYEANGFHLLGLLQNGTYYLTTSNKKLKSVNDLKDLKFRTIWDVYHMAFWSAVGSNPVPLKESEVYDYFQMNKIDAQESMAAFCSNNHVEKVQQWLNYTNHMLYVNQMAINVDAYRSLNPAYQKALNQAVSEAMAEVAPMLKEEDSKAKAKLKKRGMKINKEDASFYEEVLALEGVQALYADIDAGTDGLATILKKELRR